MKIRCISFTENGHSLNERIVLGIENAEGYGNGKHLKEKSGGLREWTEKAFKECDGIIFIGAAGIAVRAIAPFIKDKSIDPAVIVCDEMGRFVIPILSGHIGGGNRLAERIAEKIGGKCIITTATDINGVFAADVWAREKGYSIENIENIKFISSALLRGEKVGIESIFGIEGKLPENIVIGADFENGIVISVFDEKKFKNTLNVVPKCVCIGVGSRKNAEAEALVDEFKKTGIYPSAVKSVATIDIKKDERAVLRLCEYLNAELTVYSKDELEKTVGDFTGSDFVKKTVGTDNVCERACARKTGGRIILKKRKGNGVTIAAAAENEVIGFEDNYEQRKL